MSQQLVKKGANGRIEHVNPKSWIEAIKDKNTGQPLVEILQGFNMYFLPYNGNTSSTRCLVSTMLRKKGLWITYVKYDGNVYTEWYAADELDDKSWGDSSNWRIGNNTLVGDITISANGNWVINGTETEFKAVGEKGNTPLIRVDNNRLQVSYDLGDTYRDVTDNPVYTKFRWLATSGDTQANNVGRIQASTDEGKTWTNMSNEFTNNLHIKKYIGVNESLPTSGIAEGTIYAKGPYYAEGDTLNDNPIYRLWVYAWKGNTLAWQDNGEFQSIVAGVVQETGDSETQVMSQKVVTEKLSELGSVVGIYNVNTDEIFNVSNITNAASKVPQNLRKRGSIIILRGSDKWKLYQYKGISDSIEDRFWISEEWWEDITNYTSYARYNGDLKSLFIKGYFYDYEYNITNNIPKSSKSNSGIGSCLLLKVKVGDIITCRNVKGGSSAARAWVKYDKNGIVTSYAESGVLLNESIDIDYDGFLAINHYSNNDFEVEGSCSIDNILVSQYIVGLLTNLLMNSREVKELKIKVNDLEGIFQELENEYHVSNNKADLDISDEAANTIVSFKNGHIKTKYFDSEKVESGSKSVKILIIGNSYSAQACGYAPMIAEESDASVNVELMILYQGGVNLETHNNAFNEDGTYTMFYYSTKNKKWNEPYGGYTIKRALDYTKWDVLLLHQQSSSSRDYNTYQPYLNKLLDNINNYIDYNLRCGLVINPSYPNGYSGIGDDTSVTMFEKICSATNSVLDNTVIDFVIPCGTAIQNARTTSLDELGDFGGLSYDGLHLQEGLPILLESYVFAISILRLASSERGIWGSSIRPNAEWAELVNKPQVSHGENIGVTDDNCLLAQKCAIMAIKNPFEITDMNIFNV